MLPLRCRPPEPVEEFDPITLPVQLIVEGTHDAYVLEKILAYLRLADRAQIQLAGSKDNIPKRLSGFAKSADFVESVQAVGVLRDADNDAQAAFLSVKDAFSRSDNLLPVPNTAFEVVEANGKRAGIAILPNGIDRGAMETLLLRTVRDHEHMECVDQYIACSREKTKDRRYDDVKAKVALLLGGYYGEYRNPATGRELWDPASQAFEQLRSFLSQLCSGG